MTSQFWEVFLFHFISIYKLFGKFSKIFNSDFRISSGVWGFSAGNFHSWNRPPSEIDLNWVNKGGVWGRGEPPVNTIPVKRSGTFSGNNVWPLFKFWFPSDTGSYSRYCLTLTYYKKPPGSTGAELKYVWL